MKSFARVLNHSKARCFSTSSRNNFKVVIAGSAGGVGQPLSMLMKMSRLVTRLELYDIAPMTHGLGVDLSHMDTPAKVTGYEGREHLADVLKDANLVVVAAGTCRSPGMTREELFNANAPVILDITQSIAENAPNAVVTYLTNPVDSVVPYATEVLKRADKFDPARVIGVTTLDVVRASSFIGENNDVDPGTVTVPVIGGHSGNTIIPLLSQSQPPVKLSDNNKMEALTKRIQEAESDVLVAKAGFGAATLSMAYAGARLAMSVLRGLKGEPKVVECAYVKSDITEASFFANPVLLGKCGVEKNLGFGKLSEYEQLLLRSALPELKRNIRVGEEYAKLHIVS